MASDTVIDIDALLVPIAGDNPAGSDIREDSSSTSSYQQIKDARAGARTSERNIMKEGDPDKANLIVPEWETVLDAAPRILSTQAKDLEVAAWYTEGLLRHYGLPGLRDGFRLIKGLVENFWDNLYPLPDEEGLETKVAPLIGLNGQDGEGALMVPINKVFLTEPGSYPPFAAWQYEQALEVEKIADAKKKDARIAAGAVSMEMIEQAVRETSSDFFIHLKEDIEDCVDAFQQMTASVDQRCGEHAPPSSNISNRLNRLKEIVAFLTKDIATGSGEATQSGSMSDSSVSTATTAAVSRSVSAAGSATISSGAIGSRDDAHRVMLQVAEFFRQTEPHSPVSYMLEQAVRWGNMTLPDLLSELITDERARQEYFKMTGIPLQDKRRK